MTLQITQVYHSRQRIAAQVQVSQILQGLKTNVSWHSTAEAVVAKVGGQQIAQRAEARQK